MNPKTLNLLITLAGVAALLIPTLPIMFRPKGSKKRITLIGWAMFAVGFIILGLSIANIHFTEKAAMAANRVLDSTRKANDSLAIQTRTQDRDSILKAINHALAKKKLQYNPAKGEVILVSPFLTLPQIGKPNPYVSKYKSEFLYNISFTNIRESPAKNIKTHFAVLTPRGATFGVDFTKYNIANETIVLPKGSRYEVSKGFKQGTASDSTYIYFKLTYTDEYNTPQAPLRTLYLFMKDSVDVDLLIPNQLITEKIKEKLKENFLW